MSLQDRSPEEREAASIVVGLSIPALSSMKNSTKRSREEDDDNDDTSELQSNTIFPASKKTAIDGVEELDATGLVFAPPVLKPAPYFYYSDHSLEEDDDPLTPVTAAGRVPTFPASECSLLCCNCIFIVRIFVVLVLCTRVYSYITDTYLVHSLVSHLSQPQKCTPYYPTPNCTTS